MSGRGSEPCSASTTGAAQRLGVVLRAVLSQIKGGRLRTPEDAIQTAAIADGVLAGEAELARLARLLAHSDARRSQDAAKVVVLLVYEKPNIRLCSQVRRLQGRHHQLLISLVPVAGGGAAPR